MRYRGRMEGLKKWVEEELCKGRMLKTKGRDLSEELFVEPKCYTHFYPMKPDGEPEDISTTAPSILIMPKGGQGKYTPEQRFDRYNHVHRVQEFGQTFGVSMLFSVYEPGIRLPGFYESGIDRMGLNPEYILDGTDQGAFALFDWIDDAMEKILAVKTIPETDLTVNESTLVYAPYVDQEYIRDKRPIHYGFVNVEFYGHAGEDINNSISNLLD